MLGAGQGGQKNSGHEEGVGERDSSFNMLVRVQVSHKSHTTSNGGGGLGCKDLITLQTGSLGAMKQLCRDAW